MSCPALFTDRKSNVAEGLLSGMLGDDEEKPEAEAPESAPGAEAFAAAIAAIASRQDPGVARKTEEFLTAQSELLMLQTRHLEDEHALRLAHLLGQQREGRLRRTGIRFRIAFQIFAVAVAACIGAGIVAMIHDAATSRQVVIEPFHTPPVLAERGLDGTVVAGQLLDVLSHLQDATRSSAAARTLSGAWTSNIKVEVPETGLSIGELSRFLTEHFGQDVHIYGDLVAGSQGELTLTVRGKGVPPKAFAGSNNELEHLTNEAAEYIYSKSQPARWSAYLSGVGRYKDVLAFCPSAMLTADPQERPAILNAWGNAIDSTGGSTREALALYRAAVKLQPDLWIGHTNIQNSLMVLGDEEGAWRAGEAMRAAAGGRPGRARALDFVNWDYLTWNLKDELDAVVADADANAGMGTGIGVAAPIIADLQMRMHDPDAAELALKTSQADPHDPILGATIHFVRARLAQEAGNLTQAVVEIEAYATAYADPAVSTNSPGYNCWIAPVEEAAGRPDKADAVLKTAGTFVDCFRFRADILDSRGDWNGALQAYGAAVALAPDLPAAYYSWGAALARHNDWVGAEAKLKAANQRGPRWADPLKVWGDVLAKQNKIQDARARYDEALIYAPNWKQLKAARDALGR